MRQTWHGLLFAHWALSPAALRPLVPLELELDLFDGRAWVGVVPFRMSGVRLRGLPSLPGTSAFPELNVRTYVRVGDRPGVFFFSLDARSRVAVWAARRWYGLPYFHAAMEMEETAGGVRYRSQRIDRGAPRADLALEYAPCGEVARSEAGSLEHFLTERYALYTGVAGRVRAGEIHHPPWPLQPAEGSMTTNSMARARGIELPGEAPLLHYAQLQEVVIWPLRAVTG